MRRLLLVQAPLALVALVALGWYWVFHTQPGAQWVWTQASSASGDTLQMVDLSGDLDAGVTISDLRFVNASVDLRVDNVFLALRLSLFPLQLQLSNVSLSNVNLQTHTSSVETATNDLSSVLESLATPLPIDLVDLTVNDVVIVRDGDESRFVIEKMMVSMSWHDRIVVRSFEVIARSASTRLSGYLQFARPFATHFDASLSLKSTLHDSVRNHDIEFNADGDLNQLSVFLTASPIESSLRGTVLTLLTSPAWDLQLDIPQTSYALGNDDIELANLRVVTTGSSNKYALHASVDVRLPEQESIRFTATANGNLSGLELDEFAFTNDATQVDGSGNVDWSTDWEINTVLDLRALDINPWIAAWPVAYPLQGKLNLSLDPEFLRISDSHLAVRGTPLSINAELVIDKKDSIVSGDLEWRNLRWPFGGETALITSDAGNLALNGSLEDWHIEGQVAIGTTTIPAGQFRIDGRGDKDHVQGAISEASLLGGTAAGSAAYNWNEHRWSANIDVADIDTGSVMAKWPGVVQGHIDASGQSAPFRLDLQIDKLHGTVRNLPIAMDGYIGLGKMRFDAIDLLVTHGASSAALNGNLYAVDGLSFDFDVDDIGRYVNESDGAFNATGQLSLHESGPTLEIAGASQELEYGNIKATDITILSRSRTDRGIDAEVTMAAVELAGTSIEDIQLAIDADKASQTLKLNGLFGPTRAHLLVDGTIIGDQGALNWNGQLRKLDLTIADRERITLLEPAAIHLSAARASISRTCVGDDHGMRLCTSAGWSYNNDRGDVDLSLRLIDLPVDIANEFIDTRMNFEQLLSGRLDWRKNSYSGVTGSGELTLSPGTITSDERPELAIETGKGLLAFDIADGELLSGNAALPMPGFGGLDAVFSVSDINNRQTSSISGSLDLTLSDVALLASYLPVIDAAHGSLQTGLKLAGTLAEPLVSGSIDLAGGRIVYRPIGLTIDELNLSGNLEADGLFQLEGTFKAGDGRGEIKNRSNRKSHGNQFLELELRGDNLTLINVKDIQASADIDIRIGYGQDTLTIGGRTEFLHARVKPSNLNLARDAESEDVVIVAGELPQQSNKAEPGKLQIAGSLEVAFGDDISIDLGLATARLTGRTLFTWEDDLIPIADGRYDLTGNVQAYGQVLEITEGGLSFPKIPADNPFIRLRAVRQIYGNPQVKTAGILVDGSIRRPGVTAYTNPLTTEERALAMLVTGSDFDFEQGVGAIDFGTYIAPRVFVSYGVSLFEQENVLRVRYDLSRGFGITATSGEKEAGLDLNYRLER